MSREVLSSIEAELRRYKGLAEAAAAQLDDAQLAHAPSPSDNAVATVMRHVAGNLASRFTDFLGSDGEKPWRNRDSEFEPPPGGRDALLERWEAGWSALFAALAPLGDADLSRTVAIRGRPLSVAEALHRALAHTSYHVGQVVYVAKMLRGDGWTYLSIPPGASEAYNRDPALEKPSEHAAAVVPRTAAPPKGEGEASPPPRSTPSPGG